MFWLQCEWHYVLDGLCLQDFFGVDLMRCWCADSFRQCTGLRGADSQRTTWSASSSYSA